MVDAGLTGKKTDALLSSINVDPKELDAIFITHEHRDHISGAGVLARKYDLPIYANGETWEKMETELEKIIGPVRKDLRKKFRIEEEFYFKDIFIRPVPIFHDAINPNGYVFEKENCKISVVTDTGWVSTEMEEMIKDSDIYFLESNHDVDMLKDGHYPWPLKQRVLSTRGHLSNDNSADVVRNLVKGNGEIILLSHLSKDNNTPELAYESMAKTLDEMGIDEKMLKEGAVDLDVAARYDTSKFYNKEEK